MKPAGTVQEPDRLGVHLAEAIADRIETDPLAMRPLNHVVDIDALASVIGAGDEVQVTFDYDDHAVVVRGDGTILVDGDESTGRQTEGPES